MHILSTNMHLKNYKHGCKALNLPIYSWPTYLFYFSCYVIYHFFIALGEKDYNTIKSMALGIFWNFGLKNKMKIK